MVWIERLLEVTEPGEEFIVSEIVPRINARLVSDGKDPAAHISCICRALNIAARYDMFTKVGTTTTSKYAHTVSVWRRSL